ncbi:MAG TPA: hypothetical protein VEH48_00250 [Candidatus Nitrosopolaris sp.]|nr:hypothetical protein [Candidatus Nitrosopolaris sp.]
MERDQSGRLVLIDDTDVLNSYEVLPNSDDLEEQELLELLSGEVHAFPIVLSAVQSEILMKRIQETASNPTESPSIIASAQELLDSLG